MPQTVHDVRQGIANAASGLTRLPLNPLDEDGDTLPHAYAHRAQRITTT